MGRVERTAEAELVSIARDGIIDRLHLPDAIGYEAVRHQVAEGRLESIGRGVWKLRDHPWDLRCRLRAALTLAGPRSAVGVRAAAHAFGWYRYRDFEDVEIIVPRGADQRTTIGRIVQTRHLPEAHVQEFAGFPMTTPARTFFDLCGDPDPGLRRRGGHPVHRQNMERVFNDILARRGVRFAHEAAVHAALSRRGRRGTVLVRELLARTGPKYTPTQSDTESLFVELLEAHGIEPPERQAVVAGPRGFIGTVDFLWRRARHVVEVDSTWHDGPLDEIHDNERDALLRGAGFTVARYRYGRMVSDPGRMIHELGVAVGVYTPSATPSSAGGSGRDDDDGSGGGGGGGGGGEAEVDAA